MHEYFFLLQYYRLAKLPSGSNFAYCDPNMEGGKDSHILQDSISFLLPFLSAPVSPKKKFTKLPETTSVIPLRKVDPEFNKYLKTRLHNPYLLKRPSQDSRAAIGNNIYHQHARLGFKYWCQPDYQQPKAGQKLGAPRELRFTIIP